MKTKLLLCLFLSFTCKYIYSQENKIKIDQKRSLGSAIKSAEISVRCSGEILTPTADLKWKPVLTKKINAFEPEEQDHELIEKIKNEKLIHKNAQLLFNDRIKETDNSLNAISPVVGSNWLGNTNNGSSPMDNSIAISDGGIIVSVANTTIEIDNSSGALLYYNDLVTLINDFSISGVCDPVVIYDKFSDRFIMFCQTSPITANSKLIILFSKSNNPANDGWWRYSISGNPFNNNEGFDYPKLAVSNNELYIAGNLFFQPSGTFHESILYQIQKAPCYNGGNIVYQIWNSIPGTPFTLLPVGSGHGLSYAPGCYLIATTAAGSSSIKLYDLTDDMTASNETLNYFSVPTTPYSPAPDSYQLGTSCLLQNGDCRTLSGFYLNGIIHFVFHSDIGNGWNGINYNRLNVSSQTNQSKVFGLSGSYDYSYPSVASYATSPTDKSVMIGFGRVSASIHPEIRVVNCDDAMNWSNSTLVKGSSSFVSYTGTLKERWGDYTGTSRKHNSITPSIWMNGMFGRSDNKWDTWIAQIHDTVTSINETSKNNSLKIFPNPIAETFAIEFELDENTLLEISIFDIEGKLIKELYQGRALQGENVFSFNKGELSNGTYFLYIKSKSNTIKNEKIVIGN